MEYRSGITFIPSSSSEREIDTISTTSCPSETANGKAKKKAGRNKSLAKSHAARATHAKLRRQRVAEYQLSQSQFQSEEEPRRSENVLTTPPPLPPPESQESKFQSQLLLDTKNLDSDSKSSSGFDNDILVVATRKNQQRHHYQHRARAQDRGPKHSCTCYCRCLLPNFMPPAVPSAVPSAERKLVFASIAPVVPTEFECFLLDFYINYIARVDHFHCLSLLDPVAFKRGMTTEWIPLALTDCGILSGLLMNCCRRMAERNEGEERRKEFERLALGYKGACIRSLGWDVESCGIGGGMGRVGDLMIAKALLLATDEVISGDKQICKHHVEAVGRMIRIKGGLDMLGMNGLLGMMFDALYRRIYARL